MQSPKLIRKHISTMIFVLKDVVQSAHIKYLKSYRIIIKEISMHSELSQSAVIFECDK